MLWSIKESCFWSYRSTDNKTNKITRLIVTYVGDTPLPLLSLSQSEMICVGCGRTVVCLTKIVVVIWTVLDEIILVEEALCEDFLVKGDVADVVDDVVDQTMEVVDTVIIKEN